MNRKIIRITIDNLLNKIASNKEIKTILKNKLEIKDSEEALRNLRRTKKIVYIWKGYYYIRDGEEIEKDYQKYSTEEIVFTILNKLGINWYIGLEGALEKHKLIWQAIILKTIINNVISGKITINEQTFIFKKIKANLIFGKKEVSSPNKVKLYYSDVEKTIIDYIYFNKKVPSELTNICDYKHMKKYLNILPKKLSTEVMLNG
jgi:hypothetical protein